MRIICRASLRWNGQVRIEPMIARQADFVWWARADMKAQLPMGLQLVHQTLLCRVKLQQQEQACTCAYKCK